MGTVESNINKAKGGGLMDNDTATTGNLAESIEAAFPQSAINTIVNFGERAFIFSIPSGCYSHDAFMEGDQGHG